MSTPSRHRVWPWILVILFGICMFPVVFVASHIGLSSEAAALRDGLKDASGATWMTRVQLKSGMLLFPARAIVSMCAVDRDARTALAAVRSASVGVYELDEVGHPVDTNETLAKLDKRMKRDGWARMVTVLDDEARVLVYGNTRDSGNTMRVCVGVIADNHLVVVSAKLRPDELVSLIDRHIPKELAKL